MMNPGSVDLRPFEETVVAGLLLALLLARAGTVTAPHSNRSPASISRRACTGLTLVGPPVRHLLVPARGGIRGPDGLVFFLPAGVVELAQRPAGLWRSRGNA